jgi:hypothetical protein
MNVQNWKTLEAANAFIYKHDDNNISADKAMAVFLVALAH